MAFHPRKMMDLTISTRHPIPPILFDVDVDEHPPPSHVDEHPPRSHVDKHPPPSHHTLFAAVIIVAVVLASAFLLVVVSDVYLRYRRRRLREATPAARPPPPPPPPPPPLPPLVEDFLDEDHGPVVDHPIWYIRTAGLNPSVISAITVCKYKVGDGLVEGTDCAVCLSEFEEGETLRLLPKCHHAFHIPCIDTWLRSHTNCPLCRAGIVADLAPPPTPLPASESLAAVASSGRHGREPSPAVVSEEASEFRNGSDHDGGGVGGDIESGLRDSPIRHENENLTGEDLCVDGLPAVVDDIQSLRRSVSLYSLSESIKNMGFASVVESSSSAEDSRNRWAKDEKSDSELVVARTSDVKQNQSLVGVMMNGSSRGRSLQPSPSFVKRSLSCGAKLFMARYRRTT